MHSLEIICIIQGEIVLGFEECSLPDKEKNAYPKSVKTDFNVTAYIHWYNAIGKTFAGKYFLLRGLQYELFTLVEHDI